MVAGLASSLRNFRGPLLEALIARSHDVHVAAPGLTDDIPTLDWLLSIGATAHDIPLSRTGLSPTGDARTAFMLYQLMRRIRPDIYLGYTIKPVIWGLLASWLAKVPKRVAMITGLGYAFTGEARGRRSIVQKVAWLLYALAMRRATFVFFQNPDDLSDFKRMKLLPVWLPRQIVNGSGVDTHYFQPASFPKPPLRFLMIARLLGDKGVREYAAAARTIKQVHPDVEFHLVGPLDPNPDGIKESEVREWTNASTLTWHGSTSDVRPFIANSHVYVLPSYREGTPRTVLEAMAMGRPIITTDAPGCRETVEDGGNGFLVNPRSAGSLHDAIACLIDNPQQVTTMGATSKIIVDNKYDVSNVNAEIIEHLDI